METMKELIMHGWTQRQHPVLWSTMVRRHFECHGDQSSELCKILIYETILRRNPSPLLLQYLQYGVGTRLLSPLQFVITIVSDDVCRCIVENGRCFDVCLDVVRHLLVGDPAESMECTMYMVLFLLKSCKMEGHLDQRVRSLTVLWTFLSKESTWELVYEGKRKHGPLWDQWIATLGGLERTSSLPYRQLLRSCSRTIAKMGFFPFPLYGNEHVQQIQPYHPLGLALYPLRFQVHREWGSLVRGSPQQDYHKLVQLALAKNLTIPDMFKVLLILAYSALKTGNHPNAKIIRNYLLVKIPLWMKLFKSQSNGSLQSTVIDVIHYFGTPVSGDTLYEFVTEAVTREIILPIFGQEISKPTPQQDVQLVLQYGPVTPEDVELLRQALNNDTYYDIATCTLHALPTCSIQEHLVEFLLEILQQNDVPTAVAFVYSRLREDSYLLDILNMHGKLPVLLNYLLHHLDTWGVGYDHHYFGEAYLLLVALTSYFGEMLEDAIDCKVNPTLSAPCITAVKLLASNLYDTPTVDLNKATTLFSILYQSTEITREEEFKQFLCTCTPWALSQIVPVVLKQSCLMCIQNKLQQLAILEAIIFMFEAIKYPVYVSITWMINEMESGIPQPNTLCVTLLGVDIQLVNSILSSILQHPPIFALVQHDARILEICRHFNIGLPLDSTKTEQLQLDGVELVAMVHRYYFLLLTEVALSEFSLGGAMAHFKYALRAVGPLQFCEMILKEVLSVVSEKDRATSQFICAAELGGCVLGACGAQVLSILYREVLPSCLEHLVSSVHATSLAHLAFYAGLYAEVEPTKISPIQEAARHFLNVVTKLEHSPHSIHSVFFDTFFGLLNGTLTRGCETLFSSTMNE